MEYDIDLCFYTQLTYAGRDININSVAMVNSGDNSEYQLIKPGETEERIVVAQSLAGGGRQTKRS